MPALRSLLDSLPYKTVYGPVDREILAVTGDSRQVRPGHLFVAIVGTRVDGHRFIADAVQAGAAVVVQEPDHPTFTEAVTTVVVPSCRQALALLAAAFYGNPAERLRLIGITGTNGKTTTGYLVESILRQGGERVGLLGTVAYQLAEQCLPAETTTPEPLLLHRLLAQIVGVGITSVVMEVSSHALDQDRVFGLAFEVAIFTNLSRDHLDYHGHYAGYQAAKAKLFGQLAARRGVAVLNRDDPAWPAMAAAMGECPGRRVLTYGLSGEADLYPSVCQPTRTGTHLVVTTPEGPLACHPRLFGQFNVYNTLAAAGAGLALGLPLARIKTGLEQTRVDGRFERVDQGQPFTVIVDYAHTPDALENLLQAARQISRERLLVVFGCGGDRDPGKRPEMGAIASQLADLVILTSDNPRSEPPEEIIADIQTGVVGRAVCLSRVERRQAIIEAVAMARPGDCVVIAGKGHEPYQEVAGQRLPCDDRQLAREALARLGYCFQALGDPPG